EYLGSSEKELQAIAEEIEVEDEATIAKNGDSDPNADDVDDTNGWTDEVGNMTEKEQEELEENIHLIRFVLVKVRKLVYKIVHSSTFLLPEWKQKLIDLKLPVRVMPRNVSTRWNSTFDMLEFAIRYQQALD
ncbi:hypothetical protein BDR03DRAFT_823117, partial [Suillus americanus]